MASAYSAELGLSLGPVKVNEKNNEDCISHPKKQRNDSFTTQNEGHERVEIRTCHTMGNMCYKRRFAEEWPGMKTVECINMEHIDCYNHTSSNETRHFISSLPNNAESILKHIREHWKIKNKLHWHLNINFKEDLDRKKNNAAQNFSLIC